MENKIKCVHFIAGASGVGKTTLLNEFQDKYAHKNWAFLHFDDIGIPTFDYVNEKYDGYWPNWQKEKTKKWVKIIFDEYSDKEMVFIEGQTHLEFIIEAFEEYKFKNYRIYLLDSEEAVTGARLMKRGEPHLYHEGMKNWLKYVRERAQGMGIDIIDTSGLTEEEMLLEFEKKLDL